MTAFAPEIRFVPLVRGAAATAGAPVLRRPRTGCGCGCGGSAARCGCGSSSVASPAATRADRVLQVPDMSCGHCEAALRAALAGVERVAVAAVDLAARTVTLAADDAGVVAAAAAIRAAGYAVEA